MTEQIMKPGEEQSIKSQNIDLAMGAAINLHITAKGIADIDNMRQEKTMKDLLALANTREGLAMLVATQAGKK